VAGDKGWGVGEGQRMGGREEREGKTGWGEGRGRGELGRWEVKGVGRVGRGVSGRGGRRKVEGGAKGGGG